MDLSTRRSLVRSWLEAGVEAVDPFQITFDALRDTPGPATIIAIGKAAAAMSRGASTALGDVTGVCVTNAPGQVHEGVELILGDHPIPGTRSFSAGKAVLQAASRAEGRLIALISGGGSALCELPRPGIDVAYIQMANQTLLDGGASIDDTNLVRRHLSAIKGGGIAGAASIPVETLIVSDVVGGGPEVVASGPTIPADPAPEQALAVMSRFAIPVSDQVEKAMWAEPVVAPGGAVQVLADGRTAAKAVAVAAGSDGIEARVADGWFRGDAETSLAPFLANSPTGVTVAAGEPNVVVTGPGVGGRNSHVALLAARLIAGSADLFASFATDGVDGRSDGAGGLVDGDTLHRGGDPTGDLANSDSASYLARTGDLLRTGPTGTNVSDLWILWRI